MRICGPVAAGGGAGFALVVGYWDNGRALPGSTSAVSGADEPVIEYDGGGLGHSFLLP